VIRFFFFLLFLLLVFTRFLWEVSPPFPLCAVFFPPQSSGDLARNAGVTASVGDVSPVSIFPLGNSSFRLFAPPPTVLSLPPTKAVGAHRQVWDRGTRQYPPVVPLCLLFAPLFPRGASPFLSHNF